MGALAGTYPRWPSNGEGPRPKGPGPGLVSPPPGSSPFGRMLGPPPNIFCWCWCWCCFKAAFLARCCGESESESDSGSCAPTGLNRDRLIAPAPGPCGKLLFRSGGPMKPMMRFCSLLGVAAPLRCAGELPTLGTLPQFCVCERAASALRPVRLASTRMPTHKHATAASTRRSGLSDGLSGRKERTRVTAMHLCVMDVL